MVEVESWSQAYHVRFFFIFRFFALKLEWHVKKICLPWNCLAYCRKTVEKACFNKVKQQRSFGLTLSRPWWLSPDGCVLSWCRKPCRRRWRRRRWWKPAQWCGWSTDAAPVQKLLCEMVVHKWRQACFESVYLSIDFLSGRP